MVGLRTRIVTPVQFELEIVVTPDIKETILSYSESYYSTARGTYNIHQVCFSIGLLG